MHYFSTAHGKGPCDGLGGTIKRAAARASLQLPVDKQILTSKDLYNWLKYEHHFPNVHFEYSNASDYLESENFLMERYQNKSRVSKIQQ